MDLSRFSLRALGFGLVLAPQLVFAIQFMSVQDIYDQWIDYVDSDVADRNDSAEELYDDTGREAEFQPYVYSTQRNVSVIPSSNRRIAFPRTVFEFPVRLLGATGLSEPVKLESISRFDFPDLPSYIPFCGYIPFLTVHHQTAQWVYCDIPPLTFASDLWVSRTNSISYSVRGMFVNFSFCMGVPYGPYWHQSDNYPVGFCDIQTYRDITHDDSPFANFTALVHFSDAPTVEQVQYGKSYLLENPDFTFSSLDTPPASSDPVQENVDLQGKFEVHDVNPFKDRSFNNPWLP